jgi:hypothetical protein
MRIGHILAARSRERSPSVGITSPHAIDLADALSVRGTELPGTGQPGSFPPFCWRQT